MDPSQEFVYIRTYTRWLDDKQRREISWENETVPRVMKFLKEERGMDVQAHIFRKIEKYMKSMDVLPSMRLVWAAGESAKRDNTTLYNCSAAKINSIESFSECLYILMCGTGFGYRVFQEDVDKLPVVPKITADGNGEYIIADDKAGWADSVKELLTCLYAGKDLDMNYRLIRLKGAKLKTGGGTASGPDPLRRLHDFIKEMMYAAQGRRLTTLEVSDIINMIAEIVVVGGVRRSSQICLSELDDVSMRDAKRYPFPPRRYMANFSAVYDKKPSATDFLTEWAALAASGSGERGILNLYAARKNAPRRRDAQQICVSNPCNEIMLRDMEFCNLTEVVIKDTDSLSDIMDKVHIATWLGCIQATFTKFPYLRPEWKENCEEERLLGVSLTGQMDNPSQLTEATLKGLRLKAYEVAKNASRVLGINIPAAITCVKPSGTVSQLVNSASGIHARYSPHYIRRYRISAQDPLYKMMKAQMIPFKIENNQTKQDWEKERMARKKGESPGMHCTIYEEGKEWSEDKVNTFVVEFPIKAPEGSVCRKDMTVIEQLEWYKMVQKNWCEHNASNTIYVKDEEWFEVGNWVYKNWDFSCGLSFLPYDGGKYKLAPYEEITKTEYEYRLEHFPDIDYSKLKDFEKDDETEGAAALACIGDKCEI